MQQIGKYMKWCGIVGIVYVYVWLGSGWEERAGLDRVGRIGRLDIRYPVSKVLG